LPITGVEEDFCVTNHQKTIKGWGGWNVRQNTPSITEFLSEENSNCGNFYSSLVYGLRYMGSVNPLVFLHLVMNREVKSLDTPCAYDLSQFLIKLSRGPLKFRQ